MSFLWKSSNGGTTEKTLTLEEQQEKINEVRKQLEEPSSLAIQGFLSDASILRFLRARNWNVQKSSKMLKSAVKWRAAYKPEMISWEEIALEAETGKIYRADYKDKLGRTVLVLRPGLEVSSFTAAQISGNNFIIRFLRCIFYICIKKHDYIYSYAYTSRIIIFGIILELLDLNKS
ncbi:unnamed protein product [Triticum turgidum subsp. durum]|uniref:CRAL/TRIO N-terminal domain-containing protein n=1 Tax=Triticum turgidum subsp. durum TaxID=4567 RepID=A0A9R1QFX5_TRITD|nr:unnamed protein product [Triticum turgidum subsp. durum]